MEQSDGDLTCLLTQAASSPPTGLGFATSVRPLAFHLALSLREKAAGSRLSSGASSSSPASTAMSEVEVLVADGIELALNELKRGVGFFGAEGLPKLNAGWVENAEPDGLELNMVSLQLCRPALETAMLLCAPVASWSISEINSNNDAQRPATGPYCRIADHCIVAATHFDHWYNNGV